MQAQFLVHVIIGPLLTSVQILKLVDPIMPSQLGPEAEASIKHVSKDNFSYSELASKLLASGHIISKTVVSKVVNAVRIKSIAQQGGLQSPTQYHPPKKANSAIIRKVDPWTKKKNPPTQKTIVCCGGVSNG